MILIVITFFAGLQGQYTKFSKGQTVLVGLLGTFIINVLRIASVVLVAVRFGYFPAVIYHDYFSNLIIVLWLFFFWWFSYAYILEATSPAPIVMKRITRLSVKKSSDWLFFARWKKIKNIFSFKLKRLKKKSEPRKIRVKGKTKRNKEKIR